VDEDARVMTVAVPAGRAAPRTIRIRNGRPGTARIDVLGPAPSDAVRRSIRETVRRMLNLDENLAPLYEAAAGDPDLAWIRSGSGRMFRSPTVFEDVVKTICTTNCTWSATVRMVTALVESLGRPSAGNRGRAFPTPEAMADATESFYRDVAKTGYRGAYLRSLARSVVDGEVDLEAFATSPVPDDELAKELLELPGVGPYAAAHIMMLIGRHSRLILDSWTRPTYATLNGKKAADRQIERRFRRYGDYAGIAFWLYLTRGWVKES
jgi:N-glycosylase/DNA lyase